MRNQRGFALVVTLLVTALLVALVVEFISDVYVDTSSRRSFVDGQQASILAESGVTGAIIILQQTLATQEEFTSLTDQWARPIDIPDESGTLRLTIEEENSKLNLNRVAGTRFNAAYVESFVRLFKKLELPANDLLDALADWIDDDLLPRPGGAEETYYTDRKPPCKVSNSPLLTLEEVALVKGFAPDALPRIRRFVTVYEDIANSSFVNINTAPKEVLLALGEKMTDTLAERIIDYRKTNPFTARGELSNVAGMDGVVESIKVPLGTKGSIYRIRSEATVNGTKRIIEAVVHFVTASSPRTLYWREH